MGSNQGRRAPQCAAAALLSGAGRYWPEILTSLLLIGTTLAVYGHVCNNGFVYDDTDYVVTNPHVFRGLDRQGVLWSLAAFYSANWHPLTWLSLQLDATLFGLEPWGYHLHNLLLHVADTVLLFLVLRWATGAVWRSALAATLFALHPLHVESVAWVAERKDVLSTFFWMLTLLAYVGYARQPGLGRYLLVLLAFALGLLAKPMLVTLPCVLLLLDYWPLRRLPPARPGHLLWEKVPLFVLTAVSCVVTVQAQRAADTAPTLEALSLPFRLSNATLAYVAYLGKAVWPGDLAVYYPYVRIPLWDWRVLASAAFLLALTALAVGLRRRHPYFLVGWLWYLGTLVPVIGLVQVGGQAMADRYSYIPLVGVFLTLAWGLGDLAVRWRCRLLVTVAAAAALLVCALLTWLQTCYWHNEFTLWNHAIEVEPQNPVAYEHLGTYYLSQGQLEQAKECFDEFLKLEPTLARAHARMGQLLAAAQAWDRARQSYERALQLDSAEPDGHRGLGLIAAFVRKELSVAEDHFRQALRFRPDSPVLHHELGVVLEYKGSWKEAADSYRRAVELAPGKALYHRELGLALWECGQREAAQEEYRISSQLEPNWVQLANQQARALATAREPQRRDGMAALHLARPACQATEERDPALLDTLAAAHADLGQFDEAVAVARRALQLAAADAHLAGEIRERLQLYENKQPLREGPAPR